MIRYTAVFLAVVLVPVVTASGRGTSCSSDDDCDDRLSCLGNAGDMRCFRKKSVGMTCARDPFWVCEDGLKCEDRVCKIRRGGDCTNSDSICLDGLVCAGTDDEKRCVMPKIAGMPCARDPFWVCEDGLKCEDRVCKIRRGDDCTNSDSICLDGLVCVGTDDEKRCVMPKVAGMPCARDPFWVCASGFRCVDRVCKKAVGRGKRCGAKRVCKSRFVCAGPSRGRICVIPGRPTKRCGRFDTCRDSTCVGGRCVV